MGITAMHTENDIWSKRTDKWWQQFPHYLKIGIIASKRLQGNIDRVATPQPLAQFKDISRCWKERASAFMQRDGHHTWIIIKRTLHPGAMMRIKVEKENLGFHGM